MPTDDARFMFYSMHLFLAYPNSCLFCSCLNLFYNVAF